jgi:hypothetical protein
MKEKKQFSAERAVIAEKKIGQDQPDRQDSAAFGRRPLAAGGKIP